MDGCVAIHNSTELPARCEAIDTKTVDGDNVNNLVGILLLKLFLQSNGADNYLFLVVDKSDGAIKAIDKTFIEAEG